jgi:DNA-binding CsgD family transcriptional regulator
MVRSTVSSVLTALGLSTADERLYHRVLPLSGNDLETVGAALDVDPAAVCDALQELERRGIVRVTDGRLHVLGLTEVVTQQLAGEVGQLTTTSERLSELAGAIPFLTAALTRPGAGEVGSVRPLEGEQSTGGNPLKLQVSLIEESRGDLLWLRPDAWRMPRESGVTKAVAAAIASGRRSRAIYPVVALHEAPDVLRTRARAGEQIRVIAELPTRLIVFGTTHAVMPEPLGYADEPRLLVRQRGLVEAMTLLFELMWERAAPVPDLDLGEARPDLRRFLLQQLAAGAKDEQVARTLGISLRTVRRRVADLLIELGVDNRFQAGVEAVRRGWL